MKHAHPIIHSVLSNPLLLVMMWSLFSIGTVWIRVTYSGSDYYVFMIWNLILAVVPLIISSVLVTHKIRTTSVAFGFIVLIWLLFYPNTVYMITDFVHLQPRNGIPLWYDVVLLMSFASVGLYIGFITLSQMQIIIRKLTTPRVSWIFANTTLILSGFGVYFGRFMRWNSWDIFTDPSKILRMSSVWIMNPLAYPKILFVSVLFSSFSLLFYILMIAAHDSFFRRK